MNQSLYHSIHISDIYIYIYSMSTVHYSKYYRKSINKTEFAFFGSFGIKYILCISWCSKNQCMAKHI